MQYLYYNKYILNSNEVYVVLDDVKKSYLECANVIPDWKKLSRSDLCNKYLEVKNTNKYLADSYLSAIVYKFWNVFEHNYKTQHGNFYSETDFYQSGIDGILEALDKHVWTNPENKLYGDKNGPEKAINVTIFSLKYNIYQAASRQKRKINIGTTSLQELQECGVDTKYVKFEDDISLVELSLQEFIRMQFIKCDYLMAFLLDSIINIDAVHRDTGNINFTKIKQHLKNLNEKYLKMFSQIYDIELEQVTLGAQYITRMSSDQLNRNVRRCLVNLKHNPYIIQLIKE